MRNAPSRRFHPRLNLRPMLPPALIAAAALLLAGCVFGGEDDRDLSQYFPPPDQSDQQSQAANTPRSGTALLPPADDLENLEVAPPTALFAVQSFFHLVASGDLRAAWQRTSTETRERITADAFEQRYRDVWAEATIRGFTWSVVPQDDDNASFHEVILRYQTTFFGEIEELIEVQALRQPHWVVNWTPNLMFRELGPSGYLIDTLIELPQRGQILDRNGVVLAGEADVTIIGIHWELISDEDAVLNFFVNRVGLDAADVRARMYQNLPEYQFIPIATLAVDTPPEVLAEFQQLASMGILTTSDTRRYYPFGDTAAHVVGYMQEIDPEELAELFDEGYRAGDLVGRDGIERSFERTLAGRRGGALAVVDQNGRPVREVARRDAIPGANIRLTIDIRVQQLAENTLGEQAGAVVAIDPRNSHIIAMASWPRIDPNTIVDGVTQEEFDTFFFDERQPFINRAIGQTYAPASTFKAITLAAALEGGGYQITDRIDCPAEWTKVGDQPLRNWKEDDQGPIGLAQALAESCNTVFFELGLNLDRIDNDILPDVAAGFRFGQPTGLVGLDEESGLSPSPAWKEDRLDEGWFTGDTLNMSIGQGFLSVTVLQVANAYAALATNGVVTTPVIAQAIEPVGPADAAPELIERRTTGLLPVSADTLEQLQAALRTTVSQPWGTGFHVFQGSTLQIAGKSGTTEDLAVDAETVASLEDTDADLSDPSEQADQAQQQDEIPTQFNSELDDAQEEEDPAEAFTARAWFSAWADFRDPQLVVTVLLDDGQSGSDDAGPIVRGILEGAILNGWVP